MSDTYTSPPQCAFAVPRVLGWLLLGADMALRRACSSGIKPSWAEASLVVDAYRRDLGYFARISQLLGSRRASTQLKFSYATLPTTRRPSLPWTTALRSA